MVDLSRVTAHLRHLAGSWSRRMNLLILQVPGAFLHLGYLIQDAPYAPTGPGLLLDAILRFASVAMLLGVLGTVLLPDTASDHAAGLGYLSGALLAVAAVGVGAWSPYRDPTALFVSILTLAASLVGLTVLRAHLSRLRTGTGRIVALALTTAAVPLFGFWQSSSFLPSQSVVALTVDETATLESAPDGSKHWIVALTVDNPGEVRAMIVISGLTVCRWKDETEREAPVPGRCTSLDPPFTEQTVVNPKTRLVHRTSVATDATRPLFDARFRFAYGRGDRIVRVPGSERALLPDEYGACSGGHLVGLGGISALRSLALRENVLLYSDTADGTVPSIAVADGLRCPASTPPDLTNYYNITDTTRVWVGWPVDPPKG